MKVVITGGHHTSAVPVIEYLKEKESDIEIYWFGHKHSLKGNRNVTLEHQDISSMNLPFVDLPAGKFYKTYNLIRLAKIPLGFAAAFYHLIRIRPQAILSFGGYLAVPTVIMGWVLGIPSITHEQTVVTGYANKLISRFVRKVLISHEESKEHFPSEKVVYSGLPLRKSLFEVKSSSLSFINDLPVLYITAGKTGSHKINAVILDCLDELLNRFNVIHQCGDHSLYQDYTKLAKLYASLPLTEQQGKYYLKKFVTDQEIGEVFSKASIFVARAGAHTTYEVRTFKKLVVLIPIPWVSHNEQYLNAKVIESLGLGVILEEKDLSSETLLTSLDSLESQLLTSSVSPEHDSRPAEIISQELFLILNNEKNPQKT